MFLKLCAACVVLVLQVDGFESEKIVDSSGVVRSVVRRMGRKVMQQAIDPGGGQSELGGDDPTSMHEVDDVMGQNFIHTDDLTAQNAPSFANQRRVMPTMRRSKARAVPVSAKIMRRGRDWQRMAKAQLIRKKTDEVSYIMQGQENGTSLGKNVCIMGDTKIATHAGAFWHFMQGHLQENAGLLARNDILPEGRGDALATLSFSSKTFAGFWSKYVDLGIASMTRYDGGCKATKIERGLILTQAPVDIDHGDWGTFLQSCAATANVFNKLAMGLAAQDVDDITSAILLTANRKHGRMANNWMEVEAQFGLFAKEHGLVHKSVPDMGDLTFIEGAKLVSKVRVYASYHGSGSSWESFMPRDGIFVEFMPGEGWHCTFPYCAASLEDRAFTWILSTTSTAGYAGLREPAPYADQSLHAAKAKDVAWKGGSLPIASHNWASVRDTSRHVDVSRVIEALEFAFKEKKSFDGRRGHHAALMQWSAAAPREANKSALACSGTALQIFEPVSPAGGAGMRRSSAIASD